MTFTCISVWGKRSTTSYNAILSSESTLLGEQHLDAEVDRLSHSRNNQFNEYNEDSVRSDLLSHQTLLLRLQHARNRSRCRIMNRGRRVQIVEPKVLISCIRTARIRVIRGRCTAAIIPLVPQCFPFRAKPLTLHMPCRKCWYPLVRPSESTLLGSQSHRSRAYECRGQWYERPCASS